MKKIILTVVVFFLSVVMSYTQVLDKTIARVKLYKTEVVSQSKLNKQIEIWKRQTNQTVSKEAKKTILTATINDILISQAAEEEGIIATNQQINDAIKLQQQSLGTPISNSDLKELITAQTGLSWEEYRKQVSNRIIQEQYIFKKYGDSIKNFPAPTQSEIESTYDRYTTEFVNPAMIRVSHIFFETNSKNDASQKALITKIANQINKNPNKFKEFEEKSLDDASYEAGDLGFILRDESFYKIFGRTFINEAFNLSKGSVSGIMKSKIGYHIIMITDKRSARILDIDDPIFPGKSTTVRDRIVSLLSNEKQNTHFLDLVKQEVDFLRSKAKIKILVEDY